MNSTDTIILTNLYVSASRPDNLFEEKYLTTRRKENRVYRDEEVAALPNIWKEHPYHAEWMLRKQSAKQLIKYLKWGRKPLHILEIGCGNGWLSNQLSTIPGSRVIGSDINLTELQQASRVFARNSKLKFIFGDIRSGMLNDLKFDSIVLAACIQYFPSVSEILDTALNSLNPGGEIHILDSHLYKTHEVKKARERTMSYYMALGFPEMAQFYFHHKMDDFKPYPHRILRNPFSLYNRFFSNNPFPWVCIKNS